MNYFYFIPEFFFKNLQQKLLKKSSVAITIKILTSFYNRLQITVTKKYVPEVLNVHVNENNKKIYFFFRRISFSSSEKLTFKKKMWFVETFLNFNLFY